MLGRGGEGAAAAAATAGRAAVQRRNARVERMGEEVEELPGRGASPALGKD